LTLIIGGLGANVRGDADVVGRISFTPDSTLQAGIVPDISGCSNTGEVDYRVDDA
jgi:hypothetical protein